MVGVTWMGNVLLSRKRMWENGYSNKHSCKSLRPLRVGYECGELRGISSVQSLSRVWLFAIPWLQHARPPCPSPTPGVHSDSYSLSQWCHITISSSFVPFSSRLQSFPASGSFPMSQFFTAGGQSIGVSASTSVLPMNTQDWSPLGWTGWISLQFKGLSRVSPMPQFKRINSLVLSFLYSPTLTSIRDHWKNHSLD